MIYILIPVFGQLERLNKCITSLEEKTFSENVHVLISYENWSLGKPRGFTITANELIRSALGDNNCSEIIMVNSDTEILTEKWLDKIHDYIKENRDVGIVGPQEIMNFGDGDYWMDFNGIKHKPGEGEILEVVYVSLAFAWIRREVFEKIGILDTRFSPGYYEDYDFGVRAWLSGYRSIMLPNIQYKHARGGTFNELISKGLMKSGHANTNKFYEKWKGILSDGDRANRLRKLKELGRINS